MTLEDSIKLMTTPAVWGILDGQQRMELADLLISLKEKLERQERELDWLAKKASENPCPVEPDKCLHKDKEFKEEICIQCWRRTASQQARR